MNIDWLWVTSAPILNRYTYLLHYFGRWCRTESFFFLNRDFWVIEFFQLHVEEHFFKDVNLAMIPRRKTIGPDRLPYAIKSFDSNSLLVIAAKKIEIFPEENKTLQVSSADGMFIVSVQSKNSIHLKKKHVSYRSVWVENSQFSGNLKIFLYDRRVLIHFQINLSKKIVEIEKMHQNESFGWKKSCTVSTRWKSCLCFDSSIISSVEKRQSMFHSSRTHIKTLAHFNAKSLTTCFCVSFSFILFFTRTPKEHAKKRNPCIKHRKLSEKKYTPNLFWTKVFITFSLFTDP